MGGREEIARAVLFLVSEVASFITGTTLHIDGSLSIGEQNIFDEEFAQRIIDHVEWVLRSKDM